jgi:hypothetical protein
VLQHLLILLGYSIITFGIGFCVLSASHLTFKNSLGALLIGHLIITASYAVYISNGHTYLTIPLFLLTTLCSFSFIQQKKGKPPLPSVQLSELLSMKDIFVFSALLLLAYITLYFRVYTLQGELQKIHADYSFYGGVADYMNLFHIETTILDPIQIHSNYSIYHYFELWNAAFFSTLLNTTGTHALLLITYPFHLTLVLVGTITYASQKSNVSIPLILLAVLFITPLGILHNQFLCKLGVPQLILISDTGLLTQQGMKLFAVYILTLLLMTEVLSKPFNFKTVWLWVILLFIYPTTIPFALVIVCLFYSLPIIYNIARTHPKSMLVVIGSSIGIIVTIDASALFYALYEVIRYIVCFPLLIGIFFVSNQTTKVLLLQFLGSILGAIFTFMLAIKIIAPYLSILQDPSVFQLIMNFAQPLCLILSLMILMHILSKRSIVFQILSVSFFVMVYFIQNLHLRAFNREPATKHIALGIVSRLNNNPNGLIAFKRNPEDYLQSTSSWAIYFDIPFDNTRWFSKHYFPIALTLPDSTASQGNIGKESLYQSCVSQTAFAQFKRSMPADSTDLIQEKFMQKHQIDTILFY